MAVKRQNGNGGRRRFRTFAPCPACGNSRPSVFVFCSRCWRLLPHVLRSDVLHSEKGSRFRAEAIQTAILTIEHERSRFVTPSMFSETT